MDAKQAAARQAVEQVKEGMVIGLGSGSTSYWAIRMLADRVAQGLSIQGLPSSKQSEALALEWGIPLASPADRRPIDIAIDGADEVDVDGNLIKGGGGALLREKIIAFHSKRFIAIVDSSKLVARLGRFPLPVEISTFAAEYTLNRLESFGCKAGLRLKDGETYTTDNGNWIADCVFGEIVDPSTLNGELLAIPGVVETGLFPRMTDEIIVGYADGTTVSMPQGNNRLRH